MINAGSVLMWKAAARPDSFRDAEQANSPAAWSGVSHTLSPRALDEELSSNGWTFFYLANTVSATACGFNPEKRMASALKQITASVRRQGCNSLQVDAVTTRSFLGIPYLTVTAHPRHIQKGMTFAAQ